MSTVSLAAFADKLSEILPLIMREFLRRQVQEIYKGTVTLQQFLVMEFVKDHPDSKMCELATYMGVSMATMTGVVDRLVRQKYVERHFDPSDRRTIKCALTQKGSILLKEILERRRDMIINIFGKLSQTDRQDYLRILTQVKDILTNGKGKT